MNMVVICNKEEYEQLISNLNNGECPFKNIDSIDCDATIDCYDCLKEHLWHKED